MSSELICEEVDIYKLPSCDHEHLATAKTVLTIGDLHANTIKLLFILVKHGIASNITKNNYEMLIKIYTTPIHELTVEHLNRFNHILDNMIFRPHCRIRLLGDELADRGNNDYFTLKVLEKLQQSQVHVEILISNHGMEFIEAYEKQDHFHAPMLLFNRQAASIERLQFLITEKLVSREEIISIINQVYKPLLKVLSYSLNKDHSEITIYSHAPIDFKNIEQLAEKFNIFFDNTSAVKLAQTIEQINSKFKQFVINNSVNTLYTREMMHRGYEGLPITSDAPIEFLVWNRRYSILDRSPLRNDYCLNFVHGHDSGVQTTGNIYNLDNLLGKAEHLNRGIYTALFSFDHQLHLGVVKSCSEDLNSISSSSTSEDKDMFFVYSKLHLTRAQINFFAQMRLIKIKMQELKLRGYLIAGQYAERLHYEIKINFERFFAKKLDSTQFKENCYHAIQTARPELEQHRGWKQILGNLALAILGLGIFYVIAGCINKAITGNFLFFKSDSMNKIDQLEKSIHCLEAF